MTFFRSNSQRSFWRFHCNYDWRQPCVNAFLTIRLTVTDVNCRWSLNQRKRYMTRCFTRFPWTIILLLQLLCVQGQRHRCDCLSSSAWTVSATYGDGCVKSLLSGQTAIAWMHSMHGADGIWLFAVLSPLIMCINQTYCYLSHKQIPLRVFLRSLFTARCT